MFLHIDIDSFFISAERTKNPKLLNIPAAVGSRSNLEIFNKKRDHTRLININSGAFVTPVFKNDHKKTFQNYFIDKVDGKEKIRGIITTASYEARACGVKTGMPIAKALKLCPKMVVVPANYPLYHKLSRELYIYMQKEIPQVEQYSIDEFFGLTRGWIKDENIFEFALNLQKDIYQKFKLPVSIGISNSKYIAKLATEYAKPFGIYLVEDNFEFIKDIPIEQFPGIGKGFSRRFRELGIKTLGDICKSKKLLYSWKKPGIELYNRICTPNYGSINKQEAKKSIGLSRTFDAINDFNEIKRRISIIARYLSFMANRANVNPRRFELKLYYKDGTKKKDSISSNRVFSEQLLKESLLKILNKIWLPNAGGVIKLRANITSFAKKDNHLIPNILTIDKDIKNKKLDDAIIKLRQKFGLDILKRGDEI